MSILKSIRVTQITNFMSKPLGVFSKGRERKRLGGIPPFREGKGRERKGKERKGRERGRELVGTNSGRAIAWGILKGEVCPAKP